MKKAAILASLFAFLMLSAPALGIGIGPGRIEVTFVSNTEQDMDFYVSNQGEGNLSITLYAGGELGKYITLAENNATLSPKSVKNYRFHIKMPATLEPGKHLATIGAVEAAAPEGMVAAVAGVELQLWVYVAYPQKYVSVIITHTKPEAGMPVAFNVTLFNPVNSTVATTADLQILDANDTALERFDFGSLNISAGETRTVVAEWIPPAEGGYKAVARAYYGSETTRTEMGVKVASAKPEPAPPAPAAPQEIIKEAIKNPTQSPYTLLIVLLIAAIVAVAVWPTKKEGT